MCTAGGVGARSHLDPDPSRAEPRLGAVGGSAGRAARGENPMLWEAALGYREKTWRGRSALAPAEFGSYRRKQRGWRGEMLTWVC